METGSDMRETTIPENKQSHDQAGGGGGGQQQIGGQLRSEEPAAHVSSFHFRRFLSLSEMKQETLFSGKTINTLHSLWRFI